MSHLFLGAPYVPTPKKVFDELFSLVKLQGGERLYDLGAGDGRVLIEAKRRYPDITAIGYEFAPTIWAWGKLRILLSGMNVHWLRKSMLRADLTHADCVFVYLLPSLLDELAKKFDAELHPGTTVVSYTFSFSHKTPVKSVTVPWLVGERKLYLYHW